MDILSPLHLFTPFDSTDPAAVDSAYFPATCFPPVYFSRWYFPESGPLYSDLVDAVVALVERSMVAPGSLTWFGTGTSPGFGTAPLPYAVLHEPDEDDEDLNTSGDRMAEGHLEVHCYGPTKKAARALGDRVEALLKDSPLQFSAGWLVYLRQSGRSAVLDPDPAPGGGDCWDEVRLFHFRYSYA